MISGRECLWIKPEALREGPRDRYCRSYTRYRCAACHMPVCLWHSSNVESQGRLCDSCRSSWEQREDAEGYQPREEDQC